MQRSSLPLSPGIGFKPQHFADILSGGSGTGQGIGFVEIHAENYMGAGGPPHVMLRALRERFALSVHGVGLSIGSEAPLDREHLSRLHSLCDRYQPESFSEHLAWSSHGEVYLNDLLPLPYTRTTLDRIVSHIDQVQDTLGREMLLENPSTYLQFAESDIPETEFMSEISRRTGCGLLLDVNNVFVQAKNHGTRPEDYLDAFPLVRVKEIHLGGHDAQSDETGAPLLIDAHGSRVADPVWQLYRRVIAAAGPLPTLIEWDNDVPDFMTLADEAAAAGRILTRAAKRKAA
jgi:uncharacterized protein (UPF0276 family)